MNARPGDGFVELADRCFVARYREWDVCVGLVVGSGGSLVVDTRASAGQGQQVRDDVRRVAPASPVRWVVNTHQHFDHSLGNIAFGGATIHAHENVVTGLPAAVERVRRRIAADPVPGPDSPELTADLLQEVVDTELRPPDVTFSSVAVIDLGDRYVELAHPGRGHTDGDVVVRVPDADVLFAGDLVEESGPPAFGVDSFPLEWAASLDLVVGMLTDESTVVPGHGSVVGRGFVQGQRGHISDLAQLIRSLAGRRVPVDRALREGEQVGWPFPADRLGHAVRRGYEHLAGPPSRGAPPPGPNHAAPRGPP